MEVDYGRLDRLVHCDKKFFSLAKLPQAYIKDVYLFRVKFFLSFFFLFLFLFLLLKTKKNNGAIYTRKNKTCLTSDASCTIDMMSEQLV